MPPATRAAPTGIIEAMHASSEPRFLIIETGRPVASMRRHGRFPHWIRSSAGLARGEAEAVDVEGGVPPPPHEALARSEEHTSELQSLMRISYAVFCLQKKNTHNSTK